MKEATKHHFIGRVSMVGALSGSNGDYLYAPDRTLLLSAVNALSRAGLVFGDEVKAIAQGQTLTRASEYVDIVNLAPDMGNRDFLDEKTRTDLVILCNVPRDQVLASPFNRSFLLSADNSLSRWQERVAQSHAKVVVCFGGDECILVDDILPLSSKSTSDVAINYARVDVIMGQAIFKILAKRDMITWAYNDLVNAQAPLSEAYTALFDKPEKLVIIDVSSNKGPILEPDVPRCCPS